MAKPQDFREKFLAFAIGKGVLLFGEFQTKAGRLSPYFFNAGLFNDGDSLWKLAESYTDTIEESGIEFDMLFGPAYKGIPLVSAISVVLAQRGRNIPFAYNRKEAKNHGEGGNIIGAPLVGRMLIIDDVISAGTSVRESVELIRTVGAEPAGVIIALDRQERGHGDFSAVQEVHSTYGIPAVAIATLENLLSYLEKSPAESGDDEVGELVEQIKAYRDQYGAIANYELSAA